MRRFFAILLIAIFMIFSSMSVFAEVRDDSTEKLLSEGTYVEQDSNVIIIMESDSPPWPGPDIE